MNMLRSVSGGKDLIVSDVSLKLTLRVEAMVEQLEKKLGERAQTLKFQHKISSPGHTLISTDEVGNRDYF